MENVRREVVESKQASIGHIDSGGPARTLRIGETITVYGDLKIIAVEGRRVTVRVVPPSSPPPSGVMFPAR